MSNKAKYISLLLISLLGLGLFLGIKYYLTWKKPNTLYDGKLYIPANATWQDLQDSLKPLIKNWNNFLYAAEKENLKNHIRPGRYSLQSNWNNEELIRFLKTGKQDEIPIRIGNYFNAMHMAGRISPFLEIDSLEIMEALEKSTLNKDKEFYQWHHFIIPNTYNFHWAISAENFVKKMEDIYYNFWTDERNKKAESLNYSKYQVTTLASIVQLESYQKEEQATVAGVYINRLKSGMKLDADPTVIFAWSVENPNEERLKRVLFKHLKVKNPYNTYIYKGLPPGPICMPDPNTIDAVLNYEQNPYYYFVANPEKAGYHIFAKTYQEHLKNANKYRRSLN